MISSPAPQSSDLGRRRSRWWWLKWLIGVAVLMLLMVEGCYLWPRLHQSWRSLRRIDWFWVAMAIWAEALSFSAFARIQKQLLNAGGVVVSQRRSLAVIYAANSMSVTLPAGQVFSTAFTYRQIRRWGAPPLVASWELAMSGVIAAAGLALLGFGGALLGVGSVSPYALSCSVAGVIALVWVAQYAARRPDVMERIARWSLERVNRLRSKPGDVGMDRVRQILGQLESVDMHRRDGIATFIWILGHRAGDVACLGFSCLAVGATPNWTGLMVAFAAGKAVGTIPLVPAGLGYVDATLFAALSGAAGIAFSEAVPAVFIYRLISLILVAIVGWIVFVFLFRRHRITDADLDAEIDAELER